MKLLTGKPVHAPEDGFYIQEPTLYRRRNTRGGRLEPYVIVFRHQRLSFIAEGKDGLIAWKPLNWPTEA